MYFLESLDKYINEVLLTSDHMKSALKSNPEITNEDLRFFIGSFLYPKQFKEATES